MKALLRLIIKNEVYYNALAKKVGIGKWTLSAWNRPSTVPKLHLLNDAFNALEYELVVVPRSWVVDSTVRECVTVGDLEQMLKRAKELESDNEYVGRVEAA